MAFDSPRIAELRRRVQADPSSIAFAQLAEEHRRGGNNDEAVRVCRAGLERHPGYLSARVTLGRALMELGQLDDAELEFDLVLGTAADNLAAIRGVAEIHQRRGDLQAALGFYQTALGLARHDPDLEETVAQISRSLSESGQEPAPGLSFEQMKNELLSAADRVPWADAGESIGVVATSEPDASGTTPTPTSPEALADPTPDSPALVDEPSSTALAEAELWASEAPGLFDFDGLLEALGQSASAPAPPQVEAWLAPAVGSPEVSTPAPPAADEPHETAEESIGPTKPFIRASEFPAGSVSEAVAASEVEAPAEVVVATGASSEASDDTTEPKDAAGQSSAASEVTGAMALSTTIAPAEDAEAGQSAPPAPALLPAEQAALDELERWLEVLEDARGSSPAA